ncbi:hypothetical protein WJX75_006191 [Coccomyxa subellipsoidea]|uniref:DCD domain-containing protein n=1 Tax=Coccomyxa subellipsoidea TaxID=248742 RepID=A0ABR2YTM3_9CHLO
MGAGRKTFSYDVDTRTEPFPLASFEASQRNLGDELGGCIFGCTHETYEECVNGLVFGLPRPHWCYVQHIKKGMPIFLFNYNSRQLHGIFRAVSDGDWKINPHGWVGHTNRETQYPSQVQVEVYSKCPPLDQADYYQIIKNCYYPENSGHRNKMMFELRKVEAQNLCRAFDRAAGVVNANSRPQPVPRSALPAGVPGPSAAAAPSPPVAPKSAAAMGPPKAAPVAAAAPAAAAPKAAAAAAGKAMENGSAAGGWEVMAGAKKAKGNAWGAGADKAVEPVSNGEASSSKASAAKEPAAPATPPATPKATASDPGYKEENNAFDAASKSSSGSQSAAAPGPPSTRSSSNPPPDRTPEAWRLLELHLT